MKKNFLYQIACTFGLLTALGIAPAAEAQILRKVQKAAERTVERKIEQKVEKETSKAVDAVLEGDKSKTDKAEPTQKKESGTTAGQSKAQTGSSTSEIGVGEVSNEAKLEIYSRSDWVPGKTLLLFEDFNADPIGDFPQLWNTNSSGEIVKLGESEQKWLKMFDRGDYQPDLPKGLPDDYTIEFDVLAHGLSKESSMSAAFEIALTDGSHALESGASFARVTLPLYQNSDYKTRFYSVMNNKAQVSGEIGHPVSKPIAAGAHISISVKGQRYRMYLNGEKMIDMPRALNTGLIKGLLLTPKYLKNGTEHILVTNLRIAEGLPGAQEKLFVSGKFVTDAIQFDINSAEIKAESYGVLKQVAEALKSESAKKVMIVGHTDADGEAAYNLELSKKRAAAVKQMLVEEFAVEATRLETDGKGETTPIAENNSTLNKAKNRRTEFILK